MLPCASFEQTYWIVLKKRPIALLTDLQGLAAERLAAQTQGFKVPVTVFEYHSAEETYPHPFVLAIFDAALYLIAFMASFYSTVRPRSAGRNLLHGTNPATPAGGGILLPLITRMTAQLSLMIIS